MVSRSVGHLHKAFGKAASVAGSIASAVGTVAQYAPLLGLGRPPATAITTVIASAPNADLSLGVGTSPGVFVTDLDPAVVGTTSVGIGGWSNEDEMGMKFFGKIWNLVAGSDSSNEYPTSSAAGATIYTVPVSPATIDSGYASAASPVF